MKTIWSMISGIVMSILVGMGILVMGFASTISWLVIGVVMGISVTKIKDIKNEY